MEKYSHAIRTILFNILIILTILLIYFLFFPKKSYVKTILDNNKSSRIEETFNTNINNMKIASQNYFENNESNKVTLQELIDNNLLTNLKDSEENICDTNSYSEISDDKLTIYLKCQDKEQTVEIKENKKTKLLCLYEYRKEIEQGYTEWSDWSQWSIQEIEENELTNVETKIEEEPDDTKIITDTKQISIDATKNEKLSCPDGYYEENSKCKKKVESNSINASISYSCPDGYTRNGLKCYNNTNTIDATKNYYCPSNQTNIEFELLGSECKAYNIRYIETNTKEEYYTCPNGYKLKENKCYKTEEYEKEITNYKEVKYYRYQTRKKTESKFDIIWSSKENENLKNSEYNITRNISCEF